MRLRFSSFVVNYYGIIISLVVFIFLLVDKNGHFVESAMSKAEKNELKNKVLQMFDHAFKSYMTYAYPADELMPLSCKGRYRNKEPLRGDIDEVLGNYTLTLVDSLDTLALLGRIDDFEQAVRNVIETTHFDRDLVVSVFESNIRMVGGLLSGHVSVIYLKSRKFPNRFKWYNGELLDKAKDLAYRLLPAFNTSTGLPMPRVNLKYGITRELLTSEKDKSTCTACAGTLLLEFVLLSRLTGDPIFEEKVLRTMDYLWDKRNRNSDLVGTVINVNDGEWLNKDASIGAGIDSYYEYLFKGYILMGDETLLYRFNKHYSSISRYMSLNPENYEQHGSSMRTVHMHMPNRQARNYIDALLAFWPGLQVLKGDIRQAIRFHEELHQIVRKHDYFMPEAVLFDHSAHWANHPLRPEFLESTYYLYKSTRDDHYLEIGKRVIAQFEKHSRVPCGYAAIADVKTKQHDDRMDSFVFAETFKYLYLLYAEDSELMFDIDEFLFSTEAHLLPLNMMDYIDKRIKNVDKIKQSESGYLDLSVSTWKDRTCPSLTYILTPDVNRPHTHELLEATRNIRESILESSTDKKCKNPSPTTLDSTFNFKLATGDHTSADKYKQLPLRASEFNSGRTDHIALINRLGIKIKTIADGRVQLVHKTSDAASFEDAELGILFMTDMLEYSKSQKLRTTSEDDYKPMHVVPLTKPLVSESRSYLGGPAQYGYELRSNLGVFGKLALADPIDACSELSQKNMYDTILVAKRGNCIFIEKSRFAQKAGAIGLIIVDNTEDSSYSTSPLFAMSGDGVNDVRIPSVFLFNKEGNDLIWNVRSHPDMIVFMGDVTARKGLSGPEYGLTYNMPQLRLVLGLDRNQSCSKWEIFVAPQELECRANDRTEIRSFYELYYESSTRDGEDEDRDVIQITTIDDVIIVKTRSSGRRVLEIDLESIELEVRQVPGQNLDDMHAYAIKVFDLLLARFVKQTNFMKLKNTELYSKSLFNYVYSAVHPNKNGLSQEDRDNLSELAQLLEASY